MLKKNTADLSCNLHCCIAVINYANIMQCSVFGMFVYRVCLVGFRLWVHLKPGMCAVHAAIWLISVNSALN